MKLSTAACCVVVVALGAGGCSRTQPAQSESAEATPSEANAPPPLPTSTRRSPDAHVPPRAPTGEMRKAEITDEHVRTVAGEIAQANLDIDAGRYTQQLADEARVTIILNDKTYELSKWSIGEYLTKLRGVAAVSKYAETEKQIRTDGPRATYQVVVEESGVLEGKPYYQRSNQMWELEMRDGRPLIVAMRIEQTVRPGTPME